jgi:serine/threonine protein kinase
MMRRIPLACMIVVDDDALWSPSGMAEIINSRLDRYVIQERIGAGGMARVYKAWDTNLERPVAVKILHEHLADDSNFKERFEREAKLVAALNHPNIVQIYDFNAVERDGSTLYYMVMSYIPGKTLRDLLEELAARDEILSFDRILELMFNLIDAIGYAHAAGMVHRDVKPGNILLNEHGQAVLTDFGIARMLQSARLTQDGVSTGTPAYMSPEQVSGLAGDARSDLYSLGVIFFELLTGRLPYEDEGGLSLMLKHLNAPVPAVSDFLAARNEELDGVIYKALAKEPDNRYQSAQEFAADLKTAFLGTLVTSLPKSVSSTAGGFTTSPRPTPTSTQTAPTMPTPRPANTRSMVGALVLVATVIVLIGIFVLNRPPQIPGLAQPDIPTQASPSTDVPSMTGDDGDDVPSMTGDDDSAPSMTGSVFFTSSFDADDATRSDWPQDNDGGLLREITPEGFYHLHSERNRTAFATIYEGDDAYGNASISMTGTINAESNPAGAFGIAFRYTDPDHYNVFAVDGMGRYSIWVRNDGAWTELRQAGETWTRNDAIKRRGEQNTLLLDIIGSSLMGFVNNEQVVSVTDDTFSEGGIGIYLATHDTGITDVLVDSYQVLPASPPSMTGG